MPEKKWISNIPKYKNHSDMTLKTVYLFANHQRMFVSHWLMIISSRHRLQYNKQLFHFRMKTLIQLLQLVMSCNTTQLLFRLVITCGSAAEFYYSWLPLRSDSNRINERQEIIHANGLTFAIIIPWIFACLVNITEPAPMKVSGVCII